MNTSEPLLGLLQARQRVLEIQTKLHRWANDDPHRRFDDLFNLVTDPSFLLMAWERVEGNKGARSAGVDGRTAASVRECIGVEDFLAELRDQLRSRSFRPLPVRERMIPKPGSRKRRRLGIPTVADRVVQASLKLVLEPIFEADFEPCSYGFRRRVHRCLVVDRGPPGASAKCSSRTDSATLASSGERIPPWGVPVTLSLAVPISVRMPAFRNAFTSASTRLSATRVRTRSIRVECEISSKQAVMSPSNTHS